jgi:hypothetical protein
MNHPNLLYLFSKEYKYEVPIVAYIGTGESQLNNYILLSLNNSLIFAFVLSLFSEYNTLFNNHFFGDNLELGK